MTKSYSKKSKLFVSPVAGQGVMLAGGRHQIPSLSHSLSCGVRERRQTKLPPGSEGGIEVPEQGKRRYFMRIVVKVDKRTFEFEGSDLKEGIIPSISSHSWEGFSSFSVKYLAEDNTLLVEYWAEWPWINVDGKEERLF